MSYPARATGLKSAPCGQVLGAITGGTGLISFPRRNRTSRCGGRCRARRCPEPGGLQCKRGTVGRHADDFGYRLEPSRAGGGDPDHGNRAVASYILCRPAGRHVGDGAARGLRRAPVAVTGSPWCGWCAPGAALFDSRSVPPIQPLSLAADVSVSARPLSRAPASLPSLRSRRSSGCSASHRPPSRMSRTLTPSVSTTAETPWG